MTQYASNPAALTDEPWGEQYFPSGLAEHNAERPADVVERATQELRRYPWRSLTVAVGIGALVGLVAGRTCLRKKPADN
jgi:hypothetical protein